MFHSQPLIPHLKHSQFKSIKKCMKFIMRESYLPATAPEATLTPSLVTPSFTPSMAISINQLKRNDEVNHNSVLLAIASPAPPIPPI